MMARFRSLWVGSANCSSWHSVRSRNPSQDCPGQPVRIITPEREFSSVAQRDRYRVKTGNIVKPPVRREMNPPAVPPTNLNRLTCHNLGKQHFLADNARSK